MKLLAVDTSTEACSAALYIDGDIAQEYQLAPREHSHLILTMIDNLMKQAGCSSSRLDAVAFGRGPGSFMGVRIAAGIIQGIAFAHALPVVPVSTLAALSSVAMKQTGETQVLAAIDARMNEVYWAAYKADGESVLLLGEESVLPPDQVPIPEAGSWLGAGTGWDSYESALKLKTGVRLSTSLGACFPSAEAVAGLAVAYMEKGMTVSAAEAVPVYLRDNVASSPSKV